MKFGTIMELKENFAVVLTDACDFVKIQRSENMELGQRVEAYQNIDKKHWHIFNNKVIGALIAACLIFGITGAYVMHVSANQEPYAYVTLDINPSIELAINKEYKVISVHNFNTDGEKVLGLLSLKGETLDIALKSIIDEASVLGYFSNITDGEVFITAVPNLKHNDFKSYKDKSTKDLSDLIVKEEAFLEKSENNKISKNNKTPKINVTVETVEPEVREAANKENISTGRQYLINNAKKSGAKDITADEIKTANITELLKNHGDKLLGEKALRDYKKDNKTVEDINKGISDKVKAPIIEKKLTAKQKNEKRISIIEKQKKQMLLLEKQKKQMLLLEKQKKQMLILAKKQMSNKDKQFIKNKIESLNRTKKLNVEKKISDEIENHDRLERIKEKLERWSKWRSWNK